MVWRAVTPVKSKTRAVVLMVYKNRTYSHHSFRTVYLNSMYTEYNEFHNKVYLAKCQWTNTCEVILYENLSIRMKGNT